MSTQDFKRKLTAVFSADVAGYSKLMGEDEAATVKTLESYKQIMFSLIKQHRGRVVDSPGDNLLAEFASVVDAVQCGVAVQNELKAKNADLPENRKMQFRIGINLGDVIEEQDRIYGDGVNIAARLESCADPGGICVSKTAFDQIETKLPLGYEYLGEKEVKNIAKPVGAYRVLMEPRVTVAGAKDKKPPTPVWRRKGVLAGALAILILIIGAAVWNFYFRPPPIEPASLDKMAYPLPDKPSIAVLPFVNMSDDQQQEYFSDGMTEDLITDLSKISGLFVIARNSTFTYKGKPVKIRQVAEELGVRYVLEGSVRRVGDQVRINAQLIDATNGQHLWAERYDGSIRDVFSLQDKINQKIVAALAVKLTAGEKTLLSEKGTNDPAAYEEFLKGREHYLKFTKEDFAKAEACFKRAIGLDPNFSRAKASLAYLYYYAASVRMEAAFKISYEAARLRARLYLMEAMKKPTSIAYMVAGAMDLTLRQYDEALSLVEKALALDPSDPACNSVLGWTLVAYGRPKEGMDYAKTGMRLDPLNPARYLALIGYGLFCLNEWQEAAEAIEKALKLNPDLTIPAAAFLAASYAHLGRDKEAKAAAQIFRRGSTSPTPRFPPAAIMYFFPFKDRGLADTFVQGLETAGLFDPGPEYIHVSKEDQITGEDLRTFYYPSKISGIGPDGSQWSQQFAKDGTVTWRGNYLPGGVETGKSWLEGDKIWIQFQKFAGGLAFCRTTFRNPRATPRGNDEYVGFSDIFPTAFSRVQ
jgi:adenylate cyclase